MKLSQIQKILTALADKTRLRIISLLYEGELCVCDLMSVLKEPQSKISRHLSYLRKSGLVKARREGLWMHYRLTNQTTKLYRVLLDAVCCCRSSSNELGRDLNQLHKKKDALVACCK